MSVFDQIYFSFFPTTNTKHKKDLRTIKKYSISLPLTVSHQASASQPVLRSLSTEHEEEEKTEKSSKKSPANSFLKSPPKSLSQANSKTVVKDLVPDDLSAIFDVQISKLVDAIVQQLRGVSDLVSDKAIDPSNKKMIDAPSSDPSSVRKTVIDDLLLDPSSVNKVLVTTRPTH